ncbi:adenylyltransferase/cytidyltransferase family protein [Pasteurellaceae bacterium HPA106]|uniref:adenylyltransferase/cytidyltransferase family protein n=1 Tax=Spirabiliibacterium pneumoniae TaxID=221400 RepID=UPI001AAD1FED|nr:adenylyltransferase/cytidyltransferase family protein [Spirabiliibacterium pneumoniae]MBE2895830.1 adenylyltransferase/cytidyltransferase family protein [Spirabiliibacterium pneumoniae]
MKKIITYGTFDMLHIGHVNLLTRAKARGDYLIVGVTSDDYDRSRGKLDVIQSHVKRMEMVKALEMVDEVILETHKNQKQYDIVKYEIDEFVIGDDWIGKFDYLNEFTKVTYLPRTSGISSTMIRNDSISTLRLAVIGVNHDTLRFLKELIYVELVDCVAIVDNNVTYNHEIFTNKKYGLGENVKIFYSFGALLMESNTYDAVYITGEIDNKVELVKDFLTAGKHVLCENPLTKYSHQAKELFDLAKDNKLILLLAIKTAFFPAFNKFIDEIKSGIIGDVLEVRSTFTTLYQERGFSSSFYEQGATNLLMSYPAFVVKKIAGPYKDIMFLQQNDNKEGYDIANRAITRHENNVIGIATVGIGMKSDGVTIVSGTKGFAVIPSPWWLPRKFYIRFEEPNKEINYEYDFEGDGLRYAISEFVSLIRNGATQSDRLTIDDMLEIDKVTAEFNNEKGIK